MRRRMNTQFTFKSINRVKVVPTTVIENCENGKYEIEPEFKCHSYHPIIDGKIEERIRIQCNHGKYGNKFFMLYKNRRGWTPYMKVGKKDVKESVYQSLQRVILNNTTM